MEDTHNGFLVQLAENRLALLFAAEGEEELESFVKESCDRIITALRDYVKIKVSIIVGAFVNAPLAWKDSYLNAKEALELKFMLDPQEYFFGKDIVNLKTDNGQISIQQWRNRLELLIKLNKTEELLLAIDELFEDIRHNCNMKKDILIYLQNIFLSLLISFEEAEEASKQDYSKERMLLKKLVDCRYLFPAENNEAFAPHLFSSRFSYTR